MNANSVREISLFEEALLLPHWKVALGGLSSGVILGTCYEVILRFIG
jgi:hypothetical protein